MRSALIIFSLLSWMGIPSLYAHPTKTQLSNLQDSLRILRNYTIITTYEQLAKEKGWYIPLEILNDTFAQHYSRKDSAIKTLYQSLLYAKDDLVQLLLKDKRYYQAFIEQTNQAHLLSPKRYHQLEREKAEAVENLAKNNTEYLRLTNICIKLQSAINRATMLCAVKDYLLQKKAFPVSWIPTIHQPPILHSHTVRKANRKYQKACGKYFTNNTLTK